MLRNVIKSSDSCFAFGSSRVQIVDLPIPAILILLTGYLISSSQKPGSRVKLGRTLYNSLLADYSVAHLWYIS
jgi:hypothetical protein